MKPDRHDLPASTVAELSRRNFIRRAVGLSSVALGVTAAGFAAGAREGEPIVSRATVGAPATRIGNATQISNPPPVRSWDPGDLIFSGNPSSRNVALTFDDGPWHTYSRGIMNHLRTAGLEGRAAFAIIGNNTRYFGDVLREEVERGYQIINHTMTHTYSPSAIVREIDPAQELVRSYTGEYPAYFRSPGLTQSPHIQYKLATLGMANVFTSIDLGDWTSPRRSASSIVYRASRLVSGGNILLLHDGGSHRPTMDAIPGLLRVIRDKGLSVVTLDELLSEGALQVRKASIERTESQIRDDHLRTGDLSNMDKSARDWIVELETALEEATNLTSRQRILIREEIARQRASHGLDAGS